MAGRRAHQTIYRRIDPRNLICTDANTNKHTDAKTYRRKPAPADGQRCTNGWRNQQSVDARTHARIHRQTDRQSDRQSVRQGLDHTSMRP